MAAKALMPENTGDACNSSTLTDADWATINRLRRTYQRMGAKRLSGTLKKLAADPIRYVRIMGAFFPNMIREAIRDAMVEQGITPEDLNAIIQKHKMSTRLQ